MAKNSNGGTYGDEPAMAHDTKYFPGAGSKVFEMRYNLPRNLTCTQCILQWRYIAGTVTFTFTLQQKVENVS